MNTISIRKFSGTGGMEGRAIMAEASGPQLPGGKLTLSSIYLEVGLADAECNLNMLADVAEIAFEAGGGFLLGGDYQMPPIELNDTGFAQQFGAAVVAPSDSEATLRSGGSYCGMASRPRRHQLWPAPHDTTAARLMAALAPLSGGRMVCPTPAPCIGCRDTRGRAR